MLELRKFRRRTRGAIYVESIIIVTFLSVFMAGGLFFHRLYLTKLRVIEEARLATWSEALSGCNASDIEAPWPDEAIAKSKNEDEPSPTPEAPTMDQTTAFIGAPKHISAETQGREVKASSLVGGGTFNMRWRVKVACNEERRDDSLFGLGSQLLDAIPPIW